MIEYLVKAEITGIEIRLIKSQWGFVVIYGMERTICDSASGAWEEIERCINHAKRLA